MRESEGACNDSNGVDSISVAFAGGVCTSVEFTGEVATSQPSTARSFAGARSGVIASSGATPIGKASTSAASGTVRHLPEQHPAVQRSPVQHQRPLLDHVRRVQELELHNLIRLAQYRLRELRSHRGSLRGLLLFPA